MKLQTAAMWAVVGRMLGSSAAAIDVPVPARPPVTASGTCGRRFGASGEAVGAQPRFHADKTLTVDARLGHASLAQAGERRDVPPRVGGGRRADPDAASSP